MYCCCGLVQVCAVMVHPASSSCHPLQHMPLCTVREALEFSAELRLPADVSSVQRTAFVYEAMELLELTNLSSRKVRVPSSCRATHPRRLVVRSAPPSFCSASYGRLATLETKTVWRRANASDSLSLWNCAQTRPCCSWTSPPQVRSMRGRWKPLVEARHPGHGRVRC